MVSARRNGFRLRSGPCEIHNPPSSATLIYLSPAALATGPVQSCGSCASECCYCYIPPEAIADRRRLKVAVVSTIPWDSYLIRTNIWSYPPNAIIGPTVFSIPAEELFFFVIQTYNTALLYILLSKVTFYPKYLLSTKRRKNAALERDHAKLDETASRIIGQLVIAAVSIWAGIIVLGFRQDGTTAGILNTKYQYLALILAWAGPFLFLLW